VWPFPEVKLFGATTTGAAKAIGLVMTQLKGKLIGYAKLMDNCLGDSVKKLAKPNWSSLGAI